MVKVRFLLLACFTLAAFDWAGDLAWSQATTAPIQSSISRGGWKWPVIPGCLSDPEIKTNGTTDFNSPICSLYELLLTSGVTDIELRSARHLNAEMDGVLYPAFVPGTEVVVFVVTEKFNAAFHGPTGLVRVATRAVTARNGSWWTTLDAVSEHGRLLDANAIREKLALTDTPSCIAYAETARSGVRAYMGVVAPAFDEPGGAVEFWFPPYAVVAKDVKEIPGGIGCDLQ